MTNPTPNPLTKMNLFKRTFGWALALLVIAYAAGCDSTEPDDDGGGEEEVITRVVMTFSTAELADAAVAEASFDEAGVLQDVSTLRLNAGTTYFGEVVLRNEFASDPAEQDLTAEVRAEDEAHRLFYTPGGGLGDRITISDLSTDSNGDPLGLDFTLTVEGAEDAMGTLNVKLRHYEDPSAKPDDDGVAEVPGVVENDVNIDFPVVISAAATEG